MQLEYQLDECTQHTTNYENTSLFKQEFETGLFGLWNKLLFHRPKSPRDNYQAGIKNLTFIC